MRIAVLCIFALAGAGPAFAQLAPRSFGPPGGYESGPPPSRDLSDEGGQAGGGPGGDLSRARRGSPGFALEQPPSPGLSGSGDLTRHSPE